MASSFEHVGSTSVPGLAAKPIIDIDVVVTSTEALAKTIVALQPLGYSHRGDLGIAGRHAFSNANNRPKHNLYVCLEGSIGLRNHLVLRDYLRSHAEAATEYGTLKRRLAVQYPDDIDAYVEAKTAFIVQILEQSLDAYEVGQIVASNCKEPGPAHG